MFTPKVTSPCQGSWGQIGVRDGVGFFIQVTHFVTLQSLARCLCNTTVADEVSL